MKKVVNKYIEKEDYYELYIENTVGDIACSLIDKIDYEMISKYRWTIKKDEQGHY